MSGKNIFWSLVEAILFYVWIYYFIYVLKNQVNIAVSALILVIVAYLACMASPWFRNTGAYKKMMGKE